MREDKDNLTVLDHIDGISVPGSVFESAVNEYWALRTHRDGLFFLYHQVAKCEEKARHGFNPEGKLKVIAYGNLPPLTNLPMGLLACAFQWYTISACQYVRTVGAIARMQDQRRPLPRKYAEAVIPELLVYRDKVAAHYSWTTRNKKDNDAERQASIIPQISYINDRLIASGYVVTLRKSGETTKSDSIHPWSLTDMHRRLCQRYWPDMLQQLVDAAEHPPSKNKGGIESKTS